jgi:hypothetical protein
VLSGLDDYGIFYTAIEEGYTELVRLLIEKGGMNPLKDNYKAIERAVDTTQLMIGCHID